MKNFFSSLLLAALIGLSGCGSSTVDDNTTLQNANTTFDDTHKAFLYDLMQTEYLWYDQVPTDVDTSGFTDPNTMIEALRDDNDPWSYAETKAEYDNWVQQSATVSRSAAAIQHPASLLTSIDRNSSQTELSAAVSGDEASGVLWQIIVYNDIKVGHLIYDSFSPSSYDLLDQAFTDFKAGGIEELVVDLRYNLGGSLTMASILMDKIAGYANEGQPQMYLIWNDQNTDKNSFYSFENDVNSLNIPRVFFLVSGYTASASEAVINGLEPYMDDVILIGSQTYGKPVGMEGRIDGDWVYWLINFSIYNINDEGEYYDGIPVDCSASDGRFRTNPNESMLSAALFYIDNGWCK